jgi:exodeoxyribonuclease VII large subunit
LTLSATRRDIQAGLAALAAATRADLQRRHARVDGLQGRLQALSPLNILERGYALVFDASGNLVKDAARVRSGDEIRARVQRGEIRATVKKSE